MKERYLARGCSCVDIHEAIARRLYLPGSDQGILEAEFLEVPPGLFFARISRRYGIRTREEYAISEAAKASKTPCVVTMSVNDANFGHLSGKIWNATVYSDPGRRIHGEYKLVEGFQGISGRVAVVALDNMSDEDLIAVCTKVGFLLPGWKRFRYKPYEEYLKDPRFKEPTTPGEFEDWLRGLK